MLFDILYNVMYDIIQSSNIFLAWLYLDAVQCPFERIIYRGKPVAFLDTYMLVLNQGLMLVIGCLINMRLQCTQICNNYGRNY